MLCKNCKKRYDCSISMGYCAVEDAIEKLEESTVCVPDYLINALKEIIPDYEIIDCESYEIEEEK